MEPNASRPSLDDLPPAAVDVLDFWFAATPTTAWGDERPEWFRKDAAFDARIRERFGALIDAALAGTLADWPGAWGLLARIVLLDQFPRNVFRGDRRSFAGDAQALATAQRLLEAGRDLELPPVARAFAYLPFEHAEDLALQDESVLLFKRLEAAHPPSANNRDYAERHRAIVARFGRFPHRNEILGRASTPEEIEFLKSPGSRF